MEERPRVVIPSEKDTFPFVQTYIDGETYLRGQIGKAYKKILDDIIDEFELNGRVMSFYVVGMGYSRIENNVFIVNGNLGMGNLYNQTPDLEHFKKIKPFFPRGMEIGIEFGGKIITKI